MGSTGANHRLASYEVADSSSGHSLAKWPVSPQFQQVTLRGSCLRSGEGARSYRAASGPDSLRESQVSRWRLAAGVPSPPLASHQRKGEIRPRARVAPAHRDLLASGWSGMSIPLPARGRVPHARSAHQPARLLSSHDASILKVVVFPLGFLLDPAKPCIFCW